MYVGCSRFSVVHVRQIFCKTMFKCHYPTSGSFQYYRDCAMPVTTYRFWLSIFYQCPPCRAFTPQLIETYKKVKEKGNAFEIIFVSSDRSEEGYSDYFKEMPWLSTGFQEGIKKDLTQMYGVQGKRYFQII